jgi:hypothetical protein
MFQGRQRRTMVITQVALPCALLLLCLYVSVHGRRTLCSCFVFSTVKQGCMSKHFDHHQCNTQILARSAEQPLYSLLQTICAAVSSKPHLAWCTLDQCSSLITVNSDCFCPGHSNRVLCRWSELFLAVACTLKSGCRGRWCASFGRKALSLIQ